MAKKIEDYLHLYLPYLIKCETPLGVGTLCTYGVCGAFGFGMSPGFKEFLPDEGIKPILRPLSSMTEEECNDYNRLSVTLFDLNDLINQIKQESEATRFLLSKGFDLFGLIEAGLAISSLNTKNNDK